MKFKFLLSSIIILACIFYSCSGLRRSSSSASGATKPLMITLQDSGKTIQLKVYEKFDIAFGECIGCAEVWRISQINNEKLKKLPNTYSGNKCKNCAGGSQVNTFHFQVIAPGQSILEFTYFSQRLVVVIDGN